MIDVQGHVYRRRNRRRKCSWWPEFKSWMSLFVFYFTLMPLEKAWIHMFLCNLEEKTGLFILGEATSLQKENSNQPYST